VAAPEQLVEIIRGYPAGEAVTFPYPHYRNFATTIEFFPAWRRSPISAPTSL